ncbi:Chromosome partitioning ATPase, Mrp family, contains Fe-S cluster [Gemmobacter megaterium]|uniref:Chromosome partitioning ATPase, Mrp family, contains Fe-S cluster n=1 Tax=Gemmobacter megaterium TaxID=1086013 RepID=A0A1N7PRE5_9RHOB|nr:CpsD/CapB family tyrosine-protein kinase [Gemmobacter megaterium]GGE20805.1 chromosome partitioning protein [Gemmobacter megaterium]SIT13120.1 Chromosome partitioning ATPase, Mrp family, contains Fe-S cluster [Gemmobacter megaterium]
MAKAGSLMETVFEKDRSDGLDMSKDPRSGHRLAGRAVSVFGHRRTDPTVLPPLHDDDLRDALLPARHDPDRLWSDLPILRLDAAQALTNHLIISHREDPVGLLYDHLRTRLLQAMQERGWTRVAVAAPTRGCGASTVAANLALALARRPSGRTVLIDLDLRQPALAAMFGHPDPGPLREILTGEQPIEAHFCRIGRTLALGLNGRPEQDSSELLQEPETADALEAAMEDLSPDVTIYDLPPVLESDDVLAFLPEVDGILLVADGTRTTADQMRDCERLLKDRTHIIGVVLNRAEDSPAATGKRRR